MTFDLLHIVDIVALCWLFIFCHQGALTPVPANQLLSELQAAVQPTDCSHHALCVCVICWFMYWVDLVTMEMVAWWLEVTQYVLLNIYIISCDKLLQDFFFLNDSWIRNNKWSWLLYLLCWLFFYMTEASRSNLGPTWGNITEAWFGLIVL